MITSTVEVSEKGLPVSSVSILASSSFLARRRATAFRSIRERSMGGVLAHDGNAFWAEEIAASISCCEEVCIVHVGWAVEGSMVWKVLEDDDDCGLPEWNVYRSGSGAILDSTV